MKFFSRAITASAILLAQVSNITAAATLEGEWVGNIQQGEDFLYIQARFEREADSFKGHLDAFLPPFDFTRARPMTSISVDGSRVLFSVKLTGETLSFDGYLHERVMTGVVTRANRQLPFRFDQIAALTAAEYRGAYDFGGGRLVAFHTAFLLGTNLLGFLDFKSGRTGGLYASSEAEFFTGPTALVTYPVDATVRFDAKTNGESPAVEWRQAGMPPDRGTRIHLREEEIAFTNGNVTLRGTLLSPSRGKRHPALVFAPASTAMATREMARPIAQYFAFHGVACLVYDKRGTGTSTGDWLSSGFGELADDALAGVEALRSRGDIDPAQVGLWGASQGGWIVALAASRSPNVAFIMSQSGPSVTPEEQELYRSEAWLVADGFSDEVVRRAMALVRQRYLWSRTGDGWDELAAADRAVRKEQWYPYIGALGAKQNSFWKFWALIRDYDPLPALEKVRCPVLAVFGERDTYVPVPESISRWEQGLKKAGNTNVTIKVFAGADHSLLEAKTGGLKEISRVKRFVPGAFEFQKDWLLQQVKLNQ
jgi:pimeloyl-ACP methyl ester carboxylesterase